MLRLTLGMLIRTSADNKQVLFFFLNSSQKIGPDILYELGDHSHKCHAKFSFQSSKFSLEYSQMKCENRA